jgi:hypothetical protein
MKENALTLQNDDTRNKFRTLYLQGKEPREILGILGISENTFWGAVWRNTQGLRDFYNDCKAEKYITKTEDISRTILDMDTNAISDKRLATQQKEAEFIRETLGKNLYSKRIEQTGKDGATPMPIINISNNGNMAQQSRVIDIVEEKGGEV